jgi:hypothetical protein
VDEKQKLVSSHYADNRSMKCLGIPCDLYKIEINT